MKKIMIVMGKIVLWIIAIIVGLILISAITHNILTKIEKNKYKMGQTIKVDGKKMQAYVTGTGDKTIVLLSGLGTASPIIDFMPLAERLGKDYKVVILEYFGYGFSELTNNERSNNIMVNEIREALKELDINGPYILMPHSMSGIYSFYYAMNYPNEVEAIIGIDESVPNQTKVYKDEDMSPLLPFLNNLGIIRDVAYLLPSIDDGMNINDYYTNEQIKLSKMASTWNSLNRTVINEYSMGNANTKELYDVKYPYDLPVLAFLATESVEDGEWLPLHEELVTNSKIQKIEVLEGGHYLHWTKVDEIAKSTKEFISKNLQ